MAWFASSLVLPAAESCGSVGKLGDREARRRDGFLMETFPSQSGRAEGEGGRGGTVAENKRWSLWAKGPWSFSQARWKKRMKGAALWLVHRRKNKKGMRSRFVGNSFLLFEPVFSLYVALPAAPLLSLPLSSSAFVSGPSTREQTLGGCFSGSIS